MDAIEELQGYVRGVMTPLVDVPDDFDVGTELLDGELTVLLPTRAEAAYRQLLGKGGRTAESLRHLLRSWSGAQRAGFRVVGVRVLLPGA